MRRGDVRGEKDEPGMNKQEENIGTTATPCKGRMFAKTETGMTREGSRQKQFNKRKEKCLLHRKLVILEQQIKFIISTAAGRLASCQILRELSWRTELDEWFSTRLVLERHLRRQGERD